MALQINLNLWRLAVTLFLSLMLLSICCADIDTNDRNVEVDIDRPSDGLETVSRSNEGSIETVVNEPHYFPSNTNSDDDRKNVHEDNLNIDSTDYDSKSDKDNCNGNNVGACGSEWESSNGGNSGLDLDDGLARLSELEVNLVNSDEIKVKENDESSKTNDKKNDLHQTDTFKSMTDNFPEEVMSLQGKERKHSDPADKSEHFSENAESVCDKMEQEGCQPWSLNTPAQQDQELQEGSTSSQSSPESEKVKSSDVDSVSFKFSIPAIPPAEGDEPTHDGQEAEPPRQRRFFPLLYTFRTLFTSFLAEFSNDVSSSSNSSVVPSDGNLTASELLDKDANVTDSSGDSGKKTRFQCAAKNISANATGEVKIVNSTELLEILNLSKSQKMSPCVLVMFYAPWCQFCARTAPHYNALARAYPQLDILAVDTSHFSYLNARFGTVAVPNVMLFHSRSAVRFNHTSRVLETLIEFVVNNTGIEPNVSVVLQPMDFVGPLPSTVVKSRDWLLWLAWTFVLTCSSMGFVRSRYGQGVIDRLKVLWQEHQHIE